MCSGWCVIMEGQKCISCVFAWDNINLVPIWGCWVQYCDTSLSHFHHHNACNIPMVYTCRYLEMVRILHSTHNCELIKCFRKFCSTCIHIYICCQKVLIVRTQVRTHFCINVTILLNKSFWTQELITLKGIFVTLCYM